jgi:hypothetical protein
MLVGAPQVMMAASEETANTERKPAMAIGKADVVFVIIGRKAKLFGWLLLVCRMK